MKIRASMFGRAVICPGVLDLDKYDSGNVYTSVGQLGHRWLQAKINEEPDPNLLIQDQPEEWIESLYNFWEYLEESELIPLTGAQTELPVQWHISENVILTGTLDYLFKQDTTAIIADWKFYNVPWVLPPIINDYQMLTYGSVVLNMYENIQEVVIYRFLSYHCKVDILKIDRDILLPLVVDALHEAAQNIHDKVHQFFPGAQCSTCLNSRHCSAFQEQGKGVSTTEMAPYTGGHLVTADDVRRFLFAEPVIRQRLDGGIEAAKQWVKEHGPIIDSVTGDTWGPNTYNRDKIVNPLECLRELQTMVGAEALLAAKTNKSGMEKILRKYKLDPKSFMMKLKNMGAITDSEVTSWTWRKPKER